MRGHTGERPFRCSVPDCDKAFLDSTALKNHSVVHTGYRPFKCPKCHRVFARKSQLKTHQSVHTREKP
ncbi:zinc finger protein [Mycena floridula]|nr:zinc finger protein [Mycena floridula]KAJ7577641.1 zinc finger protein [Mycena floridula]